METIDTITSKRERVMSKQSAQIFIIASMFLIIMAKTDTITRLTNLNNLAFKGTQK